MGCLFSTEEHVCYKCSYPLSYEYYYSYDNKDFCTDSCIILYIENLKT